MKFYKWFMLILLFISNLCSASLLISPTKAIFEDRDRVKEITLINTSDKVNTYRIVWSQKKQTKNLSYDELSSEEVANFRMASDHIRISPRQVTLQPGERQVVKMLLRKKSDLVEGDYRSHLTFVVIPNDLEQQVNNSPSDGMQMKLNIFVNYSIPIVIRNGDPQESVQIVNAQAVADENSPELTRHIKISMRRTGEFGSYGRLHVIGENEDTGENILLGQLNGFNFLHENNMLEQNIPITEKEAFNLQSSITIKYISDIGSRDVIASKQLQL